MKINIVGRAEVPYPSLALQNAVVAAGNTWEGADNGELSTQLSADLLAESIAKSKYQPLLFKSQTWWYWFGYGDGASGQARPQRWLRSNTKPQATGPATPAGNSFGLEDAISDSTNTAVTPGAVKRNTLQLTTDQSVAGVKTFTVPLRSEGYNSIDGRVKLTTSWNFIGLELGVAGTLANFRMTTNNGKSMVQRLEGRTGLGGDGEPIQLNPINQWALHYMDPNAFQHSDAATFFATSPWLTLVRNQAKFGVNTDYPTELIEVAGGNVKADGFISKNVAAEPPTPANGGIFYVQNGALKYKGSNGTVTTLAQP
jgi:hypothetical protein